MGVYNFSKERQKLQKIEKGHEMSTNAFTNPSSGKIDQQRKILEELERRKNNINQSSSSSIGNSSSTVPEGAQSNNQQRAAMEVATKSSYGFFIPQDSSFGNFILPVIPRLSAPNDNKSTQ